MRSLVPGYRWFSAIRCLALSGPGALAIVDFVSETTSGAVLNTFRETGAYLSGHFRLTSGLHSSEYLQCALVLQHPAIAERFGRELAARLAKASVVVSPAIGGLIIGHEVARALGARFVFTERDASGKMTLAPRIQVEPGETAVVIEDVVTTGGTTREVIDLLQSAGARVLARRFDHRSQRRTGWI